MTIILFLMCITIFSILFEHTDPFISYEVGIDVVKSVTFRFKYSGWEADYNVLLLLKRIALVESDFGRDPETFRPGYYGGIWQVDEDVFNSTKNIIAYSQLRGKHDEIMRIFGIDWVNDITWQDLVKPLYSAIAAQLYLCNNPAPIPTNLQEQADYWEMNYTSSNKTAEEFVELVQMSTEITYG